MFLRHLESGLMKAVFFMRKLGWDPPSISCVTTLLPFLSTLVSSAVLSSGNRCKLGPRVCILENYAKKVPSLLLSFLFSSLCSSSSCLFSVLLWRVDLLRRALNILSPRSHGQQLYGVGFKMLS